MAKKHTIAYDSEIDALVSIAKQLSIYENRHNISSEDFYNYFLNGQMDDSEDFVEWSNAYQHFLALRNSLKSRIHEAA